MSCPDCFKGSIHDHGTAKGTEQNLYGLRTYVTGPPAARSTILFLTDAFGLGLINNKLLADRYAEGTGCKVLVPDIITGGPLPVSSMAAGEIALAPAGFNIFAQLRRLWALIRMLAVGIPWMIKAYPSKSYPRIVNYAKSVRVDLPEGGKLGVCGFCWGGYGSTKLCTEPREDDTFKSIVDAQFNAHPSFLKIPDMIIDAVKKFGVPYSSAVASEDFMLNSKKAQETEARLRTEVGEPESSNYEFVIYEGCKHGFAVRADRKNDKVGAQGYEDAAEQAVKWFNRFLN